MLANTYNRSYLYTKMFTFERDMNDYYHSRVKVALISEAHSEIRDTQDDTLTFRIEGRIVNELRSEAKLKGESLNV